MEKTIEKKLKELQSYVIDSIEEEGSDPIDVLKYTIKLLDTILSDIEKEVK